MIIVRTHFRRPVPGIQRGALSRSPPRRSSLTAPRHRPGAGADQPSGCASSRPHRAGSLAADRSPRVGRREGLRAAARPIPARGRTSREGCAGGRRPSRFRATVQAGHLVADRPRALRVRPARVRRQRLRDPGSAAAPWRAHGAKPHSGHLDGERIRSDVPRLPADAGTRAVGPCPRPLPSALAGAYGARAVEPLATPIRPRFINASRPGPPQVRPQVSAPSCRP